MGHLYCGFNELYLTGIASCSLTGHKEDTPKEFHPRGPLGVPHTRSGTICCIDRTQRTAAEGVVNGVKI